MATARRSAWAPDRGEVIWIDCNPQAGREMRDLHPFLVLSPRAFNDRTSLVVGLPMTTASYNADNPFALAAGPAGGRSRGKTSYVLCHQPKSFDWRVRGGRPHPQRAVAPEVLQRACALLNQIIDLT
jgi:mRNA interferase MazF